MRHTNSLRRESGTPGQRTQVCAAALKFGLNAVLDIRASPHRNERILDFQTRSICTPRPESVSS
ncbi:hypothetical protein C8R44DRAFT_439521 [Mycena epipterygia]|nr:hypothetical protein C8R44DRAFT_439521 [Mycena epipterygia]